MGREFVENTIAIPHHHHERVGNSSYCSTGRTTRSTKRTQKTMIVVLIVSVSILLCCCYTLNATCVPSLDASTTTVAMLHLRPIICSSDTTGRRRLQVDDDNYDDDGNSANISEVGSIAGLRLINSNIDLPIRSITNGSQYNIFNYPTLNLNMQIDTNGTVGSVLLLYSNNINSTSTTNMTSAGMDTTFSYRRIDSTIPFTLCGDTNTTILFPATLSPASGRNNIDYDTCPFFSSAGQHTMTVIPYQYTNATGQNGPPYTVTFNVLNRRTKVRNCKIPKVRGKRRICTATVFASRTHSIYFTHNANCLLWLRS